MLKNVIICKSVCKRYLKTLKMDLSFDEIEKMSNLRFKNLVKEKVKAAAFEYLISQQNKQTKILHIQYKSLDIQEYLLGGNKNSSVAKFIFKARSQTLDIKMQKKWKYEDKLCIGCNIREETGQEILSCWHFGKEESLKYEMFYSNSSRDIISLIRFANCMMKKIRQSIIDNG